MTLAGTALIAAGLALVELEHRARRRARRHRGDR
jgi:hypothetical protein